MPLLIWDASALVKRYHPELGRDTVMALFAQTSSSDRATTVWTFSETFAALLRSHNRGALSAAAFSQAIAALQHETVDDPDMLFLALEDDDVLDGIALIVQHNLNSVDATFLTAVLRFARNRAPGIPPCVLVASDQRLLRAAQAEGLTVVNPEQLPAADVPAFLAGL